MVHFYRNVFSRVPSTRVREVSHMLKAIHAQESRQAADKKAQAIVDDLRASKMAMAADLVEQAVHETLTYYGFPDIHWQKIRTNNPLERHHERNSASNPRGRRLPRRSVLPQPGGSSTAAHRRNDGQMLHE